MAYSKDDERNAGKIARLRITNDIFYSHSRLQGSISKTVPEATTNDHIVGCENTSIFPGPDMSSGGMLITITRINTAMVG